MTTKSDTNKHRRGFLKKLIGGAISTLTLQQSHADAALTGKRELEFFHTHTGKRLNVVFKRGGKYLPDALKEINSFLSDFRTGDVFEMDPELLDLIYDIREALGSTGVFEVISAYRSPKTNETLRGKSSGVARNSQHLLGKAIDVRLTDVATSDLRDKAIALKRGGVGYYAKSNFVHIDTGRVRRW